MKRMSEKEFKTYIELRKRNHKCKCGHTIELKPHESYKFCSWCGRKFIPEKMRFMNTMKEKLRGEEWKKLSGANMTSQIGTKKELKAK